MLWCTDLTSPFCQLLDLAYIYMDLGNLRPRGHFWKVVSFKHLGKLRRAFVASIGYLRQLFLIILYLEGD